MGIGNHELIIFEEDNAECLEETFKEKYNRQPDINSDEWFEFVLDEYNNYTTGGY